MASLTVFLAIWGAVVGTGSLVWNILRDRKDSAKIKVRVSWAITGGFPGTKAHLLVAATNIGKRPIVLTSWGLTRRGVGGNENRFEAVPAAGQLPKRLDEKDQIIFRGSESIEETARDLKNVWVQDSTGQSWYANSQELHQLLSDVPETLRLQEQTEREFMEKMGAAVRKLFPTLGQPGSSA